MIKKLQDEYQVEVIARNSQGILTLKIHKLEAEALITHQRLRGEFQVFNQRLTSPDGFVVGGFVPKLTQDGIGVFIRQTNLGQRVDMSNT